MLHRDARTPHVETASALRFRLRRRLEGNTRAFFSYRTRRLRAPALLAAERPTPLAQEV